MIKYACKSCNNLICETSMCPVCNGRTEVIKAAIYWCPICNAPSFEEECKSCHSICTYIGTDLRPVFPEERLLIEVLENEPFKYAGKPVWNVGANHYVIDGKKINISFKDYRKASDVDTIIKILKDNEIKNKQYDDIFNDSESILNFIKINRSRLNYITHEATLYIDRVSLNKDESEMFVSFSGGKDSTVVSDLVINTLNKNIIHIYGDTTLEYPTTGMYILRFKKSHPNIPLLISKNKDQDFNDLCKVIGPPARMLRWCCTVFKTGSITKKIDSTFRNKKSIISFQGIRRMESTARNKYDRESSESKIRKQIVVSPIIDWLDFDVWLYILSNKLDYNEAYKQGFSRVGCWCCPNNSGWSEYLSAIYMNDKFNAFRETLYDFARRIGKRDWKDYIDEGQWKKRQGGNGLEISKKSVVSFKPCAMEENTYNFDLTKPISDDLYKFFKPFGTLNFDMGRKMLNEVYVLDRSTRLPLLRISGKAGSNILKISIVGENNQLSIKKNVESMLKNQINKYQTCLGCTYCEAVCKFDAIRVFNKSKGNVSNDNIFYQIDESKCIGCLECVRHFSNGCYLNKVLTIKKD